MTWSELASRSALGFRLRNMCAELVCALLV